MTILCFYRDKLSLLEVHKSIKAYLS